VALRTATSNAAKAMGAGDQVGQIRTGMLADIVFVNGDPLYETSDLFNVRGVMLNSGYRTGKFRPQDLETGVMPDALLDSIADLPAWLH
jgi:adenine deaminase